MDYFSLNGLYQTTAAAGGLYGLTGAYGLAPAYAKFTSALQKAVGDRQTICESGDVIMSFPPRNTADYKVDESKSTKDMSRDTKNMSRDTKNMSRDTKNMSPEEYRRYICSKISDLPVSNSCRMNCNGMLVLKEEAFTNMQKDPAYEKEVLDMLEKGFQAQYPFYSSNLSLQVIGGSAKECYGTGLPALNGSSKLAETQDSGLQKARRIQEREQVYTQMSIGRGGSLAERLASNRAARLQQRENGWHK